MKNKPDILQILDKPENRELLLQWAKDAKHKLSDEIKKKKAANQGQDAPVRVTVPIRKIVRDRILLKQEEVEQLEQLAVPHIDGCISVLERAVQYC